MDEIDQNREIDNIDNEESPFKIYERRYCEKCQDYNGCIGLIDTMTMELQNSNTMLGSGFDNMIKSMGGLTFTTRFKMILDCIKARNYLSKIDLQNF